MRFKDSVNIISIALVVLLMAPAAGATTVTLFGVKNAGWSTEPLGQPYLKILDTGNTVVWSGGNSDLIATWTDFAALVEDLNDGYIGPASSGTGLGSTYTILSGGNVFSATANDIYETIPLPAGQYTISLDPSSEAYNLKGYSDSKYVGDNLWNAYVQMWTSDGQSRSFGGGTTFYGSETDALNVYGTITTSLFLSEAADLFLYINDYNSLDNTGSVTLNILPVPLPAAWLLLASGVGALVGGRRFRKTGSADR